VGNRFEVLQEGKTDLWFIVEENDHGWYVGSSCLSKRQVLRRRKVLTQDFGMQEVRVQRIGVSYVVTDDRDVCLGSAYVSMAECRKAYNLMDFSAMGHYAPKERRSRPAETRFARMLRDDVVGP